MDTEHYSHKNGVIALQSHCTAFWRNVEEFGKAVEHCKQSWWDSPTDAWEGLAAESTAERGGPAPGVSSKIEQGLYKQLP